jgi:hypothetical protein
MRENILLFYSFSLLITLSLAPSICFAQENGSPSFEAYDKLPIESVFFTHHDSLNTAAVQKKDSIAARSKVKRNVYKPAPVVPKQKSQEATDDSILSFNFLYYLIQKYKMQDIVD